MANRKVRYISPESLEMMPIWVKNCRADPAYRKKATRDVDSHGQGIWHQAAVHGELGLLECLHKEDSSLIWKTDNDGITTAHCAAMSGEMSIMKWLFKKDPALMSSTSKSGITPAHSAAGEGHLNILKFLHSKNPSLISVATTDGTRPVHCAVANNQVAIIKWLLENDESSMSALADDGKNIVHWAALSVSGALDVIKFLWIQNPGLFSQVCDEGCTCAHYAIWCGHPDIALWICERNPSLIRIASKKGQYLTHLAAIKGQILLLNWIWDQEASLFSRTDNLGFSVAHCAVQFGQLEALKFLWNKNPALLNPVRRKNISTLQEMAERAGHAKILKFLLVAQSSQQPPSDKSNPTNSFKQPTAGKQTADSSKNLGTGDTTPIKPAKQIDAKAKEKQAAQAQMAAQAAADPAGAEIVTILQMATRVSEDSDGDREHAEICKKICKLLPELTKRCGADAAAALKLSFANLLPHMARRLAARGVPLRQCAACGAFRLAMRKCRGCKHHLCSTSAAAGAATAGPADAGGKDGARLGGAAAAESAAAAAAVGGGELGEQFVTTTYYCGPECQTLHWPIHRATCGLQVSKEAAPDDAPAAASGGGGGRTRSGAVYNAGSAREPE